MKKKITVAFCVLAFLCVGYALFQYCFAPDGNTVESREQILKNTPNGTEWNISVEQEFQDYLLCGIYSQNGKSGIAIFEPKYNGYKLVSREWRDSSDEIIISGFIADGVWYDLIWFNGASTNYAELTYTNSENIKTTVSFETANMEIICNPAPSDDYTLDVVYYDKDANRYE